MTPKPSHPPDNALADESWKRLDECDGYEEIAQYWRLQAERARKLVRALRRSPPAGEAVEHARCSTCGATDPRDPDKWYCSNGFHAPSPVEAGMREAAEFEDAPLTTLLRSVGDHLQLGCVERAADEIDRLTKQLGLALEALEALADGDGPPADVAQQTLGDITRVGMTAIDLRDASLGEGK